MKALLVKILFLCLAVFLQANIISAQNKSDRQKKLPDFWGPKIKTEKIIGEIIAYKAGGSFFGIFYLVTLVKLENPINDKWFIKVNFGYTKKFPKALVAKRQKIETNVYQVSDSELIKDDFKKLLNGAENEIIPYGSSIPIYNSIDLIGEIKKLKTNE